jgi:hypothetical protein
MEADGLTTAGFAYSDLTYARDSANNKCVPGSVFAKCYGKDGKQGKMAMENIRCRTMFYLGSRQSEISNRKFRLRV